MIPSRVGRNPTCQYWSIVASCELSGVAHLQCSPTCAGGGVLLTGPVNRIVARWALQIRRTQPSGRVPGSAGPTDTARRPPHRQPL
jgi:hypothetical protein